MQAQIDAAQVYETLFVPALMGQWAPKVADAAQIQPGQRVLDVACGTGILAREITLRKARVVGLDPNPGMLAVARELDPAVDWREGVAGSLPFPDESFDAVVSQFGLMFFTDRRQALREMLRVLAPGGRLAVAVWGSLENMPAFAAEVELLEKAAGQPAADALRSPFVLGDRKELAALLPEAEITTHHGEARFPSIRTLVETDLRSWLPMMGVTLTEDRIVHILEQAEQALGSYATADGQLTFPISAHLATVAKT